MSPLILLLLATSIEYQAVTDRVPRGKPSLPEMGRAGSIVKDPAYGTRIVRITDRDTSDGASCVTAAASLQNTWNADSTRFVLMCGGALAYRFDPATLKARRDGDPLDLQETPAFSFTDPNLVYGIDGHDVVEYDFRRKKYRTLVELKEGSAGLLTVSANDRMVVPFGGMQDTWRYVLLFDKRAGKRTLLDTRRATVDGKPVEFAMDFGVHLATIDKSGRYVVISKGQGGKAPNLVVWDTETNRFGEVAPEGAGHYATGYGLLVNNSGTFPHWAQWMMRSLDPEDLKLITRLIVPDPPKDFGGRHEHSSWNNAREDGWAPVFVSVTRWADAKNPLGPWDDEIIAISTDPKRPKVFRLGLHRSKPLGDFWDVPRGNVSPDGRFFMFTSNWEGTLGNSPQRRPRQDVFVLELPPAVQ
jgi:hypothetical protein